MKRLLTIIGLLFAVTFASNLFALQIGDKAAPLKISHWVKGGEVKLDFQEKKNIYLIEFWATWCPPCRRSIPHLSKLQKKYRNMGLQVIGITDENKDQVTAFVKKQQSMEYHVAIDDEGKTYAVYMSGQEDAIPTAFLINREGVIVWIGQPLGVDEVLEGLINNPNPAMHKEVLKLQQEFKIACDLRDVKKIRMLAIELLKKDPKEIGVIYPYLNELYSKKKYELILDEIENFREINKELKNNPKLIEMQGYYLHYIFKTLSKNDTERVAKFLDHLQKNYQKNPRILNAAAWYIAEENLLIKNILMRHKC